MRNIIVLFFILVSCSKKETAHEHSAHEAEKQSASTMTTSDLMLTTSQMRLGNITTQRVVPRPVGQTIVVNGRIVANEERSQVIGSRAEGRVEKLFVKETGRTVKKGEPLYQLYSETLLTLQKEFLLAKEQYEALGSTEKRYRSFLEASKRKLILYGMNEMQIEQLAKQKTPKQWITFSSPATGVVREIIVAEGQYITEGAALMKVEDLSDLWVEAELYPSEMSLAKIGDKIKVRVSGMESDFEGTIQFLDPEYRSRSQIAIIRASLQNPDFSLAPGMRAQIFFTHSSRKALTLPVDAVIRDANGNHVYIQRGRNTFRSQMVDTGIEDFETVEITDGLAEGDTVAVTGAYLLYSEFILKNGSDPMAGHNH